MFYDTFKELCKRKGVSANKAATDIGLSDAAPTMWKKKGSIPKGATLSKLADYFGVSVEYLLTRQKESPAPANGDGLSDGQREIMALFDTLDLPDQTALLATAKALAEARKSLDGR